MLKRKIEEKLNLWWSTNTALFVDGARQVGKTYSLERFAKSKSNNYVYLNFIEKSYVIPQIIKSVDAKSFIFNLSSVVDQMLVKGDTIVFLDEIQYIYEYMDEHNIPKTDFDIVTLMKFLVEEGSYRYILSGSLLGVTIYDVVSWPTGYMTTFTMYPLDFEEFMWACDINEPVIKYLKECFNNLVPVDIFIHNKILDLFMKYIVVGGMPQAVQTYIDKNDLTLVSLSHQNIEMYNRKDIVKHAPKDKRLMISQIYDMLPEELNKQNKRFSLGILKNKNNHEIVEDSFLWLVNAGIAIPVYAVEEPIIPLRISIKRRLLKLFHEDSGLLTYIYMDAQLKNKILTQEKSINFGAIYENVCASLLRTHGYDHLYYYNNKKNGEVDFMIEHNGEVLPIEIKSGKEFERHLALNNLLSISNYKINKAYIFGNENLRIKENKIYLPIYMIEFFRKNELKSISL